MDSQKLKNLIFKIGKKQDKLAFNDIFEYFAPRVMGYLINSGSQKEVAEEITQEVLNNVWLKSQQFDQKKGNVNTWIFTIARNKRIDRIRKKENPEYNSSDLVDALYQEQPFYNVESDERIVKMQSKLDENEKKLIKMNFFQGKTHNLISKELEIPVGTIKSRIRKIITKMKKS